MRHHRHKGFVPDDTTEKYSILDWAVRPDRRRKIMEEGLRKSNPTPDDTLRRRLLAEVKIERELLRRSYRYQPDNPGGALFSFCRDVLGYDKMEWETHGELCRRLENAYWSTSGHDPEQHLHRYLFLLPRGTFKTTIASVGFPLWVAVQNDPTFMQSEGQHWSPPKSFNGKKGFDQRFLIGSEIDELATKIHENIKAHMLGTEKILDIFGRIGPESVRSLTSRWKKFESNNAWREDFGPKEANITVTSLDSSIVGNHFDIALIDDLISEKRVSNEEQIEQTKEWYRRMIPLMGPPFPCLVIFIGTRWDDKDLYGYFLDEEAGLWQVYRERAERTDEEVEAGKGRYFFPSMLGPKQLAEKQTSLRPYLYSCLYQNDPVAAKDALFKKSYFDNAYFKLPAGEHLETFLAHKSIFTTIDPAISQEKRACHAVVMTVAWDHEGTGWVLEMFRRKSVHPSDLIDVAFEHNRRWKPIQMGIEQDGFQKIYKTWADQKSRESGEWPPWVELKPNRRAKELRISGLEPIFRAGRMQLQKEPPFGEPHTAIESEAVRFPRGKYKDALDALAYQNDLAFPGSKPKTQTETVDQDPQNFLEGMMQKRLARLRIGGYGVGGLDWYNM